MTVFSTSNQSRFEFFYPLKRCTGKEREVALTNASLVGTVTCVAIGVICLTCAPLLGIGLHSCGVGALTSAALAPLVIMGGSGVACFILPCVIQQVVVKKVPDPSLSSRGESPFTSAQRVSTDIVPQSVPPIIGTPLEPTQPVRSVIKVEPHPDQIYTFYLEICSLPCRLESVKGPELPGWYKTYRCPQGLFLVSAGGNDTVLFLDFTALSQALQPLQFKHGEFVKSAWMRLVGSNVFASVALCDTPCIITASEHKLWAMVFENHADTMSRVSMECIYTFQSSIKSLAVTAGRIAVVTNDNVLFANQTRPGPWDFIQINTFKEKGEKIEEVLPVDRSLRLLVRTDVSAYCLDEKGEVINGFFPEKMKIKKMENGFFDQYLFVSDEEQVYKISDEAVRHSNGLLVFPESGPDNGTCLTPLSNLNRALAGKTIKQIVRFGAMVLIVAFSPGEEEELYLWEEDLVVQQPQGNIRHRQEHLVRLIIPGTYSARESITIAESVDSVDFFPSNVVIVKGDRSYLLKRGECCNELYWFLACNEETGNQHCSSLQLIEGVSPLPNVRYWLSSELPPSTGDKQDERGAVTLLGHLMSHIGIKGCTDDMQMDVLSFLPDS